MHPRSQVPSHELSTVPSPYWDIPRSTTRGMTSVPGEAQGGQRTPPPKLRTCRQAARYSRGYQDRACEPTSSMRQPLVPGPATPRQRKETDPGTGRQVMKVQGPDREPS